MSGRALTEAGLRLLAAWALLSALGYFFGAELLAPLLPLFAFVAHVVQSDFVPALDVAGSGADATLRMAALVVRTIPLSADLAIAPATRVDYTTTHVFHALVPAVLLLSALFAWPVADRREAWLRAALGLPALLASLLLTTPLFLAGRFQMAIVDAAVRAGSQPQPGWLVDWVLFTEGGGRWLIPLAAALACIATARRLARPRVAPRASAPPHAAAGFPR
jgi:hypothetical protein